MSEPLDLDAIEARASKATEGPWTHEPSKYIRQRYVTTQSESRTIWHATNEVFEPADAEFIAHARTDVPALVARVRELEARNTNLGIARVRAADALDRVALYGKNLTEVFRPETTECEIGGEILLRIVTNPLPSEGGPR